VSVPINPPASAASPWTWARIIYVILALAAFCFPGGVVDWLDDRNAGGWLNAPLALARGVEAVSMALGVKPLTDGLRARFTQAFGDPNS